jgi:hypothetical protein
VCLLIDVFIPAPALNGGSLHVDDSIEEDLKALLPLSKPLLSIVHSLSPFVIDDVLKINLTTPHTRLDC